MHRSSSGRMESPWSQANDHSRAGRNHPELAPMDRCSVEGHRKLTAARLATSAGAPLEAVHGMPPTVRSRRTVQHVECYASENSASEGSTFEAKADRRADATATRSAEGPQALTSVQASAASVPAADQSHAL